MRHCSLIRMLYCPFRSPFRASSLLPGSVASVRISGAASSMSSFRRACRSIALNRRTVSRWKSRSESAQRKERITVLAYTAVRLTSTSKALVNHACLPHIASRRTLEHRQTYAEEVPMTTPAKPVPSTMSRSEEVVAKHKKYIWPSVTNYYQKPLVADHAEMQHVWDVEGRRYLDFFGGILTVSVGHCNPKVTSKVNAQVNKLQHLSTLYPNEQIVALAEKIAQITPGNLSSSFFTSSGSEADEAAILIARMATGSYDIVALRHAYSGGSSLMKSVTAHAPYRKAAVISVGIAHAINPYCYRCPLHLKYPECEVACASDVENLIQTGTSGSIAAFIAEPIQGVGGFITPPKEYFKIVFSIVKKYGGLFISDEVQTGWGRTGKKWFGIEQWEVTPDILTSAKGMANGVPVGLTVTTPEIAAGFQGLNIATFGGNPVTCAAARATIELIEEDDLRENAHTVGAYFRAKLEELQEKHPLIGDVRGMGLMQALELVKDRKTKEPAPAQTTQVMERARDKGRLMGNVLRLAPMLNTTKPDVDEAIRLLDKSFSEVVM